MNTRLYTSNAGKVPVAGSGPENPDAEGNGKG